MLKVKSLINFTTPKNEAKINYKKNNIVASIINEEPKINATLNIEQKAFKSVVNFNQSKLDMQLVPSVSGRSAYKIAVEKGFVGTIEEWLDSLKGQDGKDGQEVELRVDNGYIQWKYENSGTWNSLISLNDLKGADGEEVSLQKSATHVQWKLGNGNWQNLVALVDLKGANGYSPQKGIDYFDGVDGYTPQKGIDYFDGNDGYTPIKGVDYLDRKSTRLNSSH